MKEEENLIDALRDRLEGIVGLSEKKMMGGHCFLINGHMLGGSGCNEAGDSRFMLRVGKSNAKIAESLPGWEPLLKGGRRMGGMYLVDPDQEEETLSQWISLAVSNAMSMPPK